MTHIYKTMVALFAGTCLMSASMSAAESDNNYMKPATLDYPSSYYSSMMPGMVDVTWNNEPIELIDSKTDDLGDEYVEVSVTLGDSDPAPANAYVMYLEGFDGEEDLWLLEVALYDVEGIFDFDGDQFKVTLPEGIVKNGEGYLNPFQELTFYLVDSYTDWEVTPETGSSIPQSQAVIKVSFGDNPLEYMEGTIRAYIYEPDFEEINFEYGKEITINENNELEINLTSLAPGEYEVVIPEGILLVKEGDTSYINPDLWVEYTITETSGIEKIMVKDGSTIYNLQGVKVGNADNTKVNPGIYIINGKKVIIK